MFLKIFLWILHRNGDIRLERRFWWFFAIFTDMINWYRPSAAMVFQKSEFFFRKIMKKKIWKKKKFEKFEKKFFRQNVGKSLKNAFLGSANRGVSKKYFFGLWLWKCATFQIFTHFGHPEKSTKIICLPISQIFENHRKR